jgi:glycerol-1-phosphate dehydrogenase [NAD(P)+]
MTVTIVSDTNTYAALGGRVYHAVTAAGFTTINLVLAGKEVTAGAEYILRVLLGSSTGDQVFVAVGIGTVTDITRYSAFRTRNPYIAVPTAPSVDGFVSVSAPLIVGSMKETFPTDAPVAVFADLPTLAAAPQAMIAAGFGDILGKYTSLADWNLSHLLHDEPYSAAVEARVRRALDACVAAVDAIAQRSEDGVHALMHALIESGMGMLEFGNSRPASVAEHHCSHYWEMKRLREGRPALLHGAKVGVATTLIAAHYARLRTLSYDELVNLLEAAEPDSRNRQIAEIEQVYGDAAPDILRIQAPYLNLTPQEFDALKQRIRDQWDVVQPILASVPPPEVIVDILSRLGGAASPDALGLDAETVREAQRYGHYLRDRFTIMKLTKALGLPLAE